MLGIETLRIALISVGMPHVTVLRHGESEYNVGNRDLKDCGITDKGRQQAAGLTGHYDLVVCSPLRRARETLEHSQVGCVT